MITLRQSLELGTDIGDALRVFSDEMRAKRLLRAEETANKLPVKMVIPLGGFIFPVILMLIMFPVIIRLIADSGRGGRLSQKLLPFCNRLTNSQRFPMRS